VFVQVGSFFSQRPSIKSTESIRQHGPQKTAIDIQKNHFKKAYSKSIDVQDKSWTPDG
jgi:hypothetical protein